MPKGTSKYTKFVFEFALMPFMENVSKHFKYTITIDEVDAYSYVILFFLKQFSVANRLPYALRKIRVFMLDALCYHC